MAYSNADMTAEDQGIWEVRGDCDIYVAQMRSAIRALDRVPGDR